MLTNDLVSRAHVGDMLNHADDRAEYLEWIESLGMTPTIDDDGGDDWIPNDDTPPVDSCPMIASIERDIDDTLARQARIAESKGMTLDEYREELMDRREQMREDLIAHRKYGLTGQYNLR